MITTDTNNNNDNYESKDTPSIFLEKQEGWTCKTINVNSKHKINKLTVYST